MLTKKNFLLLCLLLITALGATARTEIRDLDTFNRIKISIPADVFLEQGSSQSFEIEGDDEILDKIITEVNNGELHIKLDKKWQNHNWRNSPTIKIQIPELTALKVVGSANVQSQNPFRGNNLELSVTGSGDVSMPIEVRDLQLNITGSGDMKLNGKAQTANVKITGSGEVQAPELLVNSCDVRISGSGDCEIHSIESLNARISGSGTVYYSGSPGQVNVQSSGSGKVKKRG